MKQRSRSILWAAPVAALALTAQLSAAPPTELVEVINYGDTLVFVPTVEFERMVLTVTGPCDYQHRMVSTGEEMTFKLGETTIDGVYRFNVMREEKVSGDIRELLYNARKNFDAELPRKLCRQGLLPEPPLSVTSGFRVDRGEIIYDPDAVERPLAGATPAGDLGSASANSGDGGLQSVSAADFVINDDLIVDGSACIGFDCVNGESFSFDTIRLKENNLRIKFDDTSVAASFPRTDWQLTANASANGGASKFSIDDISGSRTPFTVEANARSHSLYVDDGGRIGSRTSTPSTEIHTIDGDTPTLRLQQDGSSGFAPQTWDVAGNETNFFIRDVTNGSTLPFRIRPSAPTSSIFIDEDGDVGVGTASPDGGLHVLRNGGGSAADLLTLENADGAARFELINATGDQWTINNSGSGFRISDVDGGATVIEFELDVDGNLTIAGGLVTGTVGSCTAGTPCDGVFADDYDLPSIEDHAEQMWANSYLPAVGPTRPDEPVNLTRKTLLMLNELEKAHIYIEQLHNQMKSEKAELEAELDQRDALLEQLSERLQRLEAATNG